MATKKSKKKTKKSTPVAPPVVIQEETTQEQEEAEVGVDQEAQGSVEADDAPQEDIAEATATTVDDAALALRALAEHAEAANVVRIDGESLADFQARVVQTIVDMPDKEWDKLPKETKQWGNDRVKELKAQQGVAAKAAKAKKTTPASPAPAPAPVPKPKDPEIVAAVAKAKEARAAKPEGRGKHNGKSGFFRPGSLGWQVCKVIAAHDGLTLNETVAACEAAGLVSQALKVRINQIMCDGIQATTKWAGRYGGLFTRDEAKKIRYIGPPIEGEPPPPAPKVEVDDFKKKPTTKKAKAKKSKAKEAAPVVEPEPPKEEAAPATGGKKKTPKKK